MDLYKLSEKIHRRILSKASHPYLVRHLNGLAVNETKLQSLILLLGPVEITAEEKGRYIMAAMLLQTALDIHDGVTETEIGEDNGQLRDRQLTVLSGDFYSGLYYHILAELGQTDLIKALAEGIKIINEEKIVLGQFKLANEQAILDSFKKIESSLLAKMGTCLNIPDLIGVFEEFLMAERLLKEKQQYEGGKHSLLYESFSRLHYRKEVKALNIGDRISLEEAVLTSIRDAYRECENKMRCIKDLYPETTGFFAGRLDKYETCFNSYVEEG